MEPTLITPSEVVKYSPIGGNSNAKIYCSTIAMKERKIFRQCLGSDFYKDLLGDLNPVPSPVLQYESGIVYTVGQFIEFDGQIFDVIQETTGEQTTCDADYFEVYPKFANLDYQYLWENYLCVTLAFLVAMTTTTYTTISQEAAGLVRKKGETYDPASVKELGVFKGEMSGDIKDLLDNMHEFLMLPENESKYPNYKGWVDACCKKDCAPRQTKFYGFNIYDDESDYCNS